MEDNEDGHDPGHGHGHDHDHEFLADDDDFDTLPDEILLELEHNAVVSTQHDGNLGPALRTFPQQVVSGNVASYGGPPPQLQPNTGPKNLQRSSLPRRIVEPQYDDESFEWIGDEGVVTPVEEARTPNLRPRPPQPREPSQREQWRYGQMAGVPHPPSASVDQHRKRPYQNDKSYPRPEADAPHRGIEHGDDVVTRRHSIPEKVAQGVLQDSQGESLGARVEQLMREREELMKELRAAKETVSMQKGEIVIIRENKIKDSKIFERQLNALQKSMQEQAERHTVALEALAEKNQQIASHNRFLKHELEEEVEKQNALQQRLKDIPPSEKLNPVTSTPKKSIANSMRDGFDDDEIMAVSPVKPGRRSKPTTPTAAGKRKRKADLQSPVRPLVLRQPDDLFPGPNRPGGPQAPKAEKVVPTVVRTDWQAERSLRFIQKIMDYEVKDTKTRLIETLMKFSYPSDTSKNFSSLVLEASARLDGKRLSPDLLLVFVNLWSRSLKEKYYRPVGLLIEVVHYILGIDPLVVDKGTITALLPVLQAAGTINGHKRFEYSPVNHSTFGQFRQTPQSALNHEVDGTACLELLLRIAYIVSDEPELVDHFWRLMDTDFVLMMLNAWQPISDLTLMLRLLATSIFPRTFGNICATEDQQQRMETYIVDRVCYLLWETPKVDEGLRPHTPTELCRFRLEALQLLTKVAISSSAHPHDDPGHHGNQLIAHHPSAIARIVRSLYDEVDAMYMLTPSHHLHAELVNRGVRLLYHVLQLQGDHLDLQKKLSAVNGGIHKHRVVLTRLAFSEGFYIDRLITDETVAMATSMLEESVTPDEADQLIEAFPNFKGRRVREE